MKIGFRRLNTLLFSTTKYFKDDKLISNFSHLFLLDLEFIADDKL